ncbi:MAG: hypothetical protein AAF383_02695 [Cyanobacteria bacterium P01_A01_bin.83]
MLSRVEKLIYNLYFCYIPIVVFALFFSSKLIQLTPTKCLLGALVEECIFYQPNLDLIYHPLNVINLLFVSYNILYLYYNVILKQDTVGKTVKNVYHKTKAHYQLKQRRKKITVLLLCYFISLILSYFRFAYTLVRAIY